MKKNKGITLIALVITIVILLILAGIAINQLTGDNGLFARSKEAKDKTVGGQNGENAILEDYEKEINKYAGECQESVENSTSTTHTATEITYSWEELSNIAKMISNNNSITNETVEVTVTLNGETKILGVGDNKKLDGKQVRILGFNHDTLTNPTTTETGKAGISFEYVEFLITAQMNSINKNSGGWKNCPLRNSLNGTTYIQLSIKDYIKPVNKEYIQTYDDASTKTTCSDYLWLLSCGEIWDNGYSGGVTRGRAIATEGIQYEYYKLKLGSTAYNSSTDITKKPNTSNSNVWWLRSPDFNYLDGFCVVNSRGYCDMWGCIGNNGVAPGFAI